MTTAPDTVEVIAAQAAAIVTILEAAVVQANEALEYTTSGQPNTAIGSLLGLDDALEQALALYRAAIAMHRFSSRRLP